MSPGHFGRERHPDRIELASGERFWNVTVMLLRPRHEAALKRAMAESGAKSYSSALRWIVDRYNEDFEDGLSGTGSPPRAPQE